MNKKTNKIAIFAPYYVHVGTERVMLKLSEGLADQDKEVHLLKADREWPGFEETNGVKLFDLKANHLVNLMPKYPSYRLWNILLTAELLPKLMLYLRREKPDVLITGLLSIAGILARDLALSKTKVIVSVQGLPRPSMFRNTLWKLFYPRADSLVFPAEDIARRLPSSIYKKTTKRVIYNPVIDENIKAQSLEEVSHKWFGPNQPPVILGVGRLTRQKDFHLLIKAFAIVRKKCNANLLILGEGEQRNELDSLATQLNVHEYLDMPGFVVNPHKYMAGSSVFVLSSKWEGPGHVLIEAMAAGVPVVTVDCPYGPREMLLGGHIGPIVPVDDEKILAQEILRIIQDKDMAAKCRKAGLERSQDFYPDKIVSQYLQLVDELTTV